MAIEMAASNRRRKPERMPGAQAFVRALADEGVTHVFGIPGGSVLPIYDALYDARIRHILVRHEQAAAHAADGYARATGRPGVCLATSGPGATNLVTGIATAWMDSIPVVAFTGNVASSLIGRDAFQEADITGITLPITKHNFLVRDVADLTRAVKEAFYIATTGRPGPVLVDLPKDVCLEEVSYEYPREVDLPGFKPTFEGHIRQVLEAAKAIGAAKRPVLYVGGGVISSGAHAEVRALAEKAGIPTTTTLMGIGGFPANHSLSLGMLGMHGTVYANWAVCNCDLLIAVGARFDDRVTGRLDRFAPAAKVVHIDIDPAEIGKNIRVDVPIVGDVKAVLQALLERVREKREEEWLAKVASWKEQYPLRYEEPVTGEIMPQRLVEELYAVTGGNAIVASDVGQHQMWLAQYYRFDAPRRHISSGGLGTMGFGLPAAMGAAIGNPGQEVWCLSGDGSFQMNAQELITLANYEIPVRILVCNNFYLGMVRQWQEMFYDRRYSHSDLLRSPDFVKLAEAHGVAALRVRRVSELRQALEKARSIAGPVLVDAHVCREANVYPMVPTGASLHDMIGLHGRWDS
jgi:acetolactate synthase-1/2/3 large subunit